MERAELLHLLYADYKSVTKMQKPDKIYIHNTNMLCALGWPVCNLQNEREGIHFNLMFDNHSCHNVKIMGDKSRKTNSFIFYKRYFYYFCKKYQL